MKRKNLMLGLAAFTLAITGAFATSMFVAIPVFINVQVAQGAPWSCRPCGITCDDAGTQPCIIQVITASVGPKLVQGRRQGCQIVLPHVTPSIQPCPALGGVWDAI